MVVKGHKTKINIDVNRKQCWVGNAPKYAYFSELDSQIRRLRCTYQGIALHFRTEAKALHIHAYILNLSVAKTKKPYCPTNSPVLRYYSYTS